MTCRVDQLKSSVPRDGPQAISDEVNYFVTPNSQGSCVSTF